MKKTVVVLSLLFISLSSFAIEDPFLELLKKLQEYTKGFPTEKVHIQLDKPYYAAGDDIWFKAYVIDGKTSKLTTMSSILNVELINESNEVVEKLLLPLQVGVSWGDFKLADTLKEGNYRIRSYTQLMKNAGQTFFFDKILKIGNSWSNTVFTNVSNQISTEGTTEKISSTIQFTNEKSTPYIGNEVSYEVFLLNKKVSSGKLNTNDKGTILIPVLNTLPKVYTSGKIVTTITLANKNKIVRVIPITTTSALIDVQFFPEGGSLLENFPNKIAIKSITANGLGEDITGKIIDNQGIEVVDFKTFYLGMGSFTFTPDSSKTYSAIIKTKDGTEKKLGLPKVEKSGYSIIVNNSDSLMMNAKVYISPDLINKGNLKLLAQRNGEIYFDVDLPTTKQFSTVNINKKDFPSGLVQLNLFNEANIPVWERFVFINNKIDKVNLVTEELKTTYTQREKIDFSLTAQSINDTDPRGTFSVSVTNNSSVTPDPENETNIYTSLLLNSEVVGYIEKPNHYFLKDDVQTRQELDNLLLTQAWRKIDWKSVASNGIPKLTFEAQQGIMISGTVTNLAGKPIANAKISNFSNTIAIYSEVATTDANGKFTFGPLTFIDKTVFVLKAFNEKGKPNARILLDNLPEQFVTSSKNSAEIELNVNTSLKNYLAQSDNYFNELNKQGLKDKTIMLNEVSIVKKINQAPKSSNYNGPGEADAVITSKDIGNMRSIKQILRTLVPGLMVEGNTYYVRGFTGVLNQPAPLDIFIDNVRLNEGNESMPLLLENQVQGADVESVELLTSLKLTALYGGAKGGVLLITTKSGLLSKETGVITYIPKGFNITREFYSPKYEVAEKDKLDFRTTVYWNPNLLFDKGKIKFDYYNTDQSGNYRVVLEGIDDLGKLARKVYTYDVK